MFLCRTQNWKIVENYLRMLFNQLDFYPTVCAAYPNPIFIQYAFANFFRVAVLQFFVLIFVLPFFTHSGAMLISISFVGLCLHVILPAICSCKIWTSRWQWLSHTCKHKVCKASSTVSLPISFWVSKLKWLNAWHFESLIWLYWDLVPCLSNFGIEPNNLCCCPSVLVCYIFHSLYFFLFCYIKSTEEGWNW